MRKSLAQEIASYRRLETSLMDFDGVEILGFDEEAAGHYERLRRMKIPIGTMDLKIASIALANNAILLSRNLVDFKKVPGLDVEDWTK
jgi:tRNA(fMet)-specific endonuclease VapC